MLFFFLEFKSIPISSTTIIDSIKAGNKTFKYKPLYINAFTENRNCVHFNWGEYQI